MPETESSVRTIKRDDILYLWAIIGLKPESYYLSFDDACDMYEWIADYEAIAIGGNHEWAEYHSIESVKSFGDDNIPASGHMWLAGDRLFGSLGEALEANLNPVKVKVKVI